MAPNAVIYYARAKTPTLAGVRINVRISESHNRTAEVTEQTLESGAVVSEHVILAPKTVTVIYEQTNARNGRMLAQDAYTALNKIWAARQPVRLVTEHSIYKDMILESLTSLHQAPNLSALQFTATLKQVNWATLTYVKVPAAQLAPEVAKTASSQVNGGANSAERMANKLAASDSNFADTLAGAKAQNPAAFAGGP
jgi:hypothetical protein